MISESRVEKALTYLRETDESTAIAKSYMIGLDDQKKTLIASEFINSVGTQGERMEKARASVNYKKHMEKYKDSVYEYEVLRNRRQTEILVIEVWRSMNANQRKGNI